MRETRGWGSTKTTDVLKARGKHDSKLIKNSFKKKDFNRSALCEWIKLLPEMTSYYMKMPGPDWTTFLQLLVRRVHDTDICRHGYRLSNHYTIKLCC